MYIEICTSNQKLSQEYAVVHILKYIKLNDFKMRVKFNSEHCNVNNRDMIWNDVHVRCEKLDVIFITQGRCNYNTVVLFSYNDHKNESIFRS